MSTIFEEDTVVNSSLLKSSQAQTSVTNSKAGNPNFGSMASVTSSVAISVATSITLDQKEMSYIHEEMNPNES
jgi:hypothetical protein